MHMVSHLALLALSPPNESHAQSIEGNWRLASMVRETSILLDSAPTDFMPLSSMSSSAANTTLHTIEAVRVSVGCLYRKCTCAHANFSRQFPDCRASPPLSY